MEYIKFLSCEEEIIYTEVENIIENTPVLSRLLGLTDEFNDKPKKNGDCYLFFDVLESKSIMLILRYIKYEKFFLEGCNESVIDRHNLLHFIKTMTREQFTNAIEFIEPYCIFIPNYLYTLANKCPLKREEDLYNEYSFLDLVININLENNEVHTNLFDYLENEWEIVNQSEILTLNSFKNSTTIISLRKRNSR